MGRSLRVGLHSPYFGSTYGGGEKYLGTVAEVLRDAYPEHRIEIVSPVPVDRERYRSVLGLDLAGITLRSGTRRVTPVHRALARAPGLRPLRNALVTRQAGALTREYDLWIAMAYVIPAVSRAARSVMLCQFPYPLRGERGRRDLAAFDPLISQSEYVRRCVERVWGRPSEVLYPPIEIPPGDPDWQAKRPWILSVGRFVAGGHVKRHDLLVRAFRQLCDGGVRGWELHLAGSLHQDRDSRDYFQAVVRSAEGYPIRVRTDIPRDELRAEYAGASLYWHAAGYGVDEASHPEALEHFGMTTVEAMAYGAVPIVIARGGQTEVVDEGNTGYLWGDLDTLVTRSRALIDDSPRRHQMAARARTATARFARETFARRLVGVLDPVFDELGRAGEESALP